MAEPFSIIFWNFSCFFCSMTSDIMEDISASERSGSPSESDWSNTVVVFLSLDGVEGSGFTIGVVKFLSSFFLSMVTIVTFLSGFVELLLEVVF